MKYKMETTGKKEFIQYYNGPALYYSIWKLRRFLRNKRKYNELDNDAWLQVEQELNIILTDNGINMEEDYK